MAGCWPCDESNV